MNWFGKKAGNGRSDQSGRQPEPEFVEISSIISGRLSSERDETVLIGIGDLMRGEAMGRKYRPSEVIDKLAEILQFPHGEEVLEKAGNALVEKLKNGVHFEDAQMIIANRLGKRNEKNAKFFVKMLDRLEYKPEMRRLAVEMLSSFRGVELSPATVDSIELALLARLMHPNESEPVKKAIKERFGKEGKGRPQIKVNEGRGDETIAADIEPAPEKDSARMAKAKEIPTQTMDVVEGLFLQLKDGAPAQKERAAKALTIMVQNSQSKSHVERIISEANKLKKEIPDLRSLCDTILSARKELPLERGSVRPPMALSPQIGDRNGARKPLGDKDKTPIVPIRTQGK